MRKIFLIYFLVFSSAAFAQITRSTSFDDRPVCESSKGVWRQFGNGCGDSCISKFDKFSVCTQALVFACDCGRGRCWDDKKCVTLKSYKEIYDIEQAKEQEILNEEKEKRREAAKENEQAILGKYLPPETDVGGNPVDPAQTPVADPTRAITQVPTYAVPTQAPEEILPQAPITPVVNPALNPTPATVAPEAPVSVEIPPFFLQKQANEAAKKKKEEEKLGGASIPPGLPQIPLPN